MSHFYKVWEVHPSTLDSSLVSKIIGKLKVYQTRTGMAGSPEFQIYHSILYVNYNSA